MPSKLPTAAQNIEELRKRHTELDRKKVTAEANLKTATDQLEALKKQARETYGTDDLEQLKTRLEAMKAENERKRSEYQKHLDEIEAGLAAVDEQYAQSKPA